MQSILALFCNQEVVWERKSNIWTMWQQIVLQHSFVIDLKAIIFHVDTNIFSVFKICMVI